MSARCCALGPQIEGLGGCRVEPQRLVDHLSCAGFLPQGAPAARRITPRLWVRRIQSDGGVERRDRFLRPTRPQQQFALSPVRELAADRGRADRGLAIRNRVLDATEAGVNVRAKEKYLRARRLDSVEGRDCVVRSAEDPQGARKFRWRFGGPEVRSLSKRRLCIHGPARREERAAGRAPTAGIRRIARAQFLRRDDGVPGRPTRSRSAESRSSASAPCAFDAEAPYPSIASSIRSKSSSRTA